MFPITHSPFNPSPAFPAHELKSLQIFHMYDPADPVITYYSPLQILETHAGFYLGTIFTPPTKPSYPEPGSRDTTYFQTLEHAQIAFHQLTLLAQSGKSKYPFDLAVWERDMTFRFKYAVKYRMSP